MSTTRIRIIIIIGIGIALDVWALPVTMAIWKETFHDRVVDLAAGENLAGILTYALMDIVAAFLIVIGIGFVAASVFVECVIRMFTNRR